MTDVLTLIEANTNTFKHFREWLFVKLDRNTDKFRNFGNYPNDFKLPYLIEYLEQWRVPILEALCYYNALSSNQAKSYTELNVFMISEEFKRIEKKEIINYTPF